MSVTTSRNRGNAWFPVQQQQQQQQQQKQQNKQPRNNVGTSSLSLSSSDWNNNENDPNRWLSSNDENTNSNANTNANANANDNNALGDWQETLLRQRDGTFWSAFEPTANETETDASSTISSTTTAIVTEEEETDAWLDTLAQLTAQEIEFNLQENDRADKVRQMMEWGFTDTAIASTLGVATDDSLEGSNEVQGMDQYRKDSYLDDIDLETVESHTMVERDPETGDLIRTQMVYVDEHTCIGCTNCAMIAQSTFFMHPEHGRARVFQQWGDDDETIQIAIETCPVDCIHYVPYDELEALEKERRTQNINFKARLVSQAEFGTTLSHLSGAGPQAFTAPQRISGNTAARCNNCPTRGCANCPMYGVGLNPEFQRREAERKARAARRQLEQERSNQQKRAEL